MAGASLQKSTPETHMKLVENKANLIANNAASDHGPEALFISALVETGEYIPALYGIKSEHVRGHRPIHEFCVRYQEESEVAPPLHLLMSKYPQFPFIKDIHPSWAASELLKAHASRVLRISIAKATSAINEEDYTQAAELLRNGIESSVIVKSRGLDFFDEAIFDRLEESEKCPIPPGKLFDNTGGIGRGEIWYIASRPNVGKSWRLAQHALTAMENGWDVAFFSLEIEAEKVADRVARIAYGNGKNWNALSMPEKLEWQREWGEQNRHRLGKLSIFDSNPKKGGIKRCDPVVVESLCGDKTLAIIDYVGLMYTLDGKPVSEDYTNMTKVTNHLKQITISSNMPIIAATQINRAGASKTVDAGLEHMAQSDSIGQDADAIITIRTNSTHTLKNKLIKNRHGDVGYEWYSMLNPRVGSFEEITPEQAQRIKEDDDYMAGVI
jgi:hypothetical protein